MKRIPIICLALVFLFATHSYAYWIWTPKTGKWVNPKTAVKQGPKEQFDFAKSLYAAQNYEEARREFKKLLKNFPKSFEASESQYYLGVVEEQAGDLYAAFQAYQKVIDKYPFSERIQEIIEREYAIAEKFMSGHKRKAAGIVLPVENPAIEIFTKVIENSSYGPLAPAAQYKLGLVLKGLLRYYEAEEAFNKVLSNYPNSEWAGAAKFQIASVRAAVSRSPDYDQWATKEAKEKFEEFVKEHPDAELSQEARKSIEQLGEKESESYFNIALFYEKQKSYDAAKVYYNKIIENYSGSFWANKARERLRALENNKK